MLDFRFSFRLSFRVSFTISFWLSKVSAETRNSRFFGLNGRPGEQFRVLFRFSEQRTSKQAPKGKRVQVTGILISIIIYVNNEIIS